MSPSNPLHLTAGILFFVLGLLHGPRPAQDVPEARPVSKDVARRAGEEFRKTYNNKDPKIRLAAVDALTSLRHPVVAKCLARAMRDPEEKVRAAAAARMGLQRSKKALQVLTIAYQARHNRKDAVVMAGILEGFRRMRRSPHLKRVDSYFEKAPKEIQRELIKTLVYHRTPETVMFLGKLLKEPKPVNVDSPTNPPASYWKKKVQAWTYWINDVHDALDHLTGRDFAEPEEVRRWLRSGGKIRKLPDEEKGEEDEGGGGDGG